MKSDVTKAATNGLQDVFTKGSGLLIPQKLGVPDAAKTGTNEYNNQTWVVGYTQGLATASFFGDPFSGGPTRLGRNVTVNGKYNPAVDGAFIAGPQRAHYITCAVTSVMSTPASVAPLRAMGAIDEGPPGTTQ